MGDSAHPFHLMRFCDEAMVRVIFFQMILGQSFSCHPDRQHDIPMRLALPTHAP